MGIGNNEKLIYTESFIADEDLTAAQYHGVAMSDDGKVDLVDADTDVPAGLLLNAPDDEEGAEVLIIGRAPAPVAETIDEGQLVRIDSNGHVALFEPGTDTTAYCCGQCIKGATTAGEYGVFMFNFTNPNIGRAS